MKTKAAEKPMRWDTREPCESCPYRKDAPIGLWDKSEFRDLLRNDANEFGGAIYGCHGTRKLPEGPSICGGWLLDQVKRGIPSMQLRLTLFQVPEANVACDQVTSGGHELYPSIRAMCRANKVR